MTDTVDVGRVQVVIPALNEEEALPGVIERLRGLGFERIRVVDNGSSDQTSEVALAAGAGVLVEDRRGYGQACWTGCEHLDEDIEWILFCDADGSDALEEVPDLLRAAENRDYVQGNRLGKDGGKNLTPVQRFGNWLSTWLIGIGWGGAFRDLGPLRLIRRESFELLAMEDRGFGWTVEMQVRVIEEGLRSEEIPVSYGERKGGRSKISGTIRGSFQAGAIILGTLGKLFLRRQDVQENLRVLASILLILGAVGMVPFGDLQAPFIVPCFLLASVVMLMGFSLAPLVQSWGVTWYWTVVWGTRLPLLWMFPGDDIWRYIWEGQVLLAGQNPYLLPPESPELEGLRSSWWGMINHPDVSAIYPPLIQGIFMMLAAILPSVFLFKVAFLVVDIFTCSLLRNRFGDGSLLYAFNPLVIYCFIGGGHYDGIFVCALVLGWLATLDGSMVRASFWLGVSVAIKWISIPLLAWCIWQRLREGKWVRATGLSIVAIVPLAATGGFLLMVMEQDQWKLPLEFVHKARSSELIPYVVTELFRESWPQIEKMNLLFAIPLGVLTGILVWTARDWGRLAERFFFVLLIFSPAVHAWYFTWLIPFACRSQSRAAFLATYSAFAYFWLQHRLLMEGTWTQGPIEKTLLWAPFVLGFIVDELWTRRRRS